MTQAVAGEGGSRVMQSSMRAFEALRAHLEIRCSGELRRCAVLAILMYQGVHAGCCAPRA